MPGQATDPIKRFKYGTSALLAVALVIASVMVILSGIEIEREDTGPVAQLLAAALIISALRWSNPVLSKVADVFGAIALTWFAGLMCGVISLMGLRMHMPLVDPALLALDHKIGIDTLGLADWLASRPQPFLPVMEFTYTHTLDCLFLGMVALAVIGQRLEVWRTAFCFLGSLLSVCVISIGTPAMGTGLWASPELLARLPGAGTRYAWPAFNRFYEGPNPVLGLHSLGAVVTFPSFHTAMGFITLAMWRASKWTFVFAIGWVLPMLAGTLTVGGHYVVDLIAGFLVWAAWFALSRLMERSSLFVPAAANLPDAIRRTFRHSGATSATA